jgi:hypothetical protein
MRAFLVWILLSGAAFGQQAAEGFRFGEPGGWVAVAEGADFRAAVAADRLSAGLTWAILEISCRPRAEGARMQVLLRYWRGGSGDDSEYLLDLFNSSQSGRPAEYDLGDGPVDTAGIAFSMSALEQPPDAYLSAVAAFAAGLPRAQRLRITFLIDGTAHAAAFPLAGAAAALGQDGGRCPR